MSSGPSSSGSTEPQAGLGGLNTPAHQEPHQTPYHPTQESPFTARRGCSSHTTPSTHPPHLGQPSGSVVFFFGEGEPPSVRQTLLTTTDVLVICPVLGYGLAFACLFVRLPYLRVQLRVKLFADIFRDRDRWRHGPLFYPRSSVSIRLISELASEI